MRGIRRIVADRLNGGILAALLAWALLFQSIGAGLAGAHMAAMQAGSGGVPCASSAPSHHDHGKTDRNRECCAVLCLAACNTTVFAVPSDGEASPGFEPRIGTAWRAGRLEPGPTPHLVVRREARAPPASARMLDNRPIATNWP